MRIKKIFASLIGLVLSCGILSGCIFKSLEETINVVFVNEGEIVQSDTISQFKNIKSPSIDEAYIPTNYRFLGWTGYKINQLNLDSATEFKNQYISAGRMVHYMDVKEFVNNRTVVLEALILPKDDIPKDYHYVVVAWYDKEATSGLTSSLMETIELKTKDYLTTKGVSQEDLNTIVFRGYTGNVGQSTGDILYDDDVDIMVGWGSLDNITTTGTIPIESVVSSISLKVLYNGATKNRYIHVLSTSEGTNTVLEYLNSAECRAIFTPEE